VLRAARALAALLALVAPAVAAPRPRAHLVYARGPGAERCPDEDALRAAVAARLGYQPFGEGEDTTIAVSIARSGRALRARIELADASGRTRGARQLSARGLDCAVLASTLELAITIAIDPLRALAPQPAPQPAAPAPSVERSDAESVEVTEVDEPAPRPERAPAGPAPRVRLRGSLGGLAAIGTSPTVVFGFTVGFGLHWRFLSVDVEGRGDIPDATGNRLSASLVYGALVPCAHVGVLSGCALFAAGAQVGSDTESTVSRRVAARYLAAGARIALEIPWGIPYSQWLALRVHADVLAPLQPVTLSLDGVALSHLPAASGSFGVAVVGYFR
jgi:hypothetical protein